LKQCQGKKKIFCKDSVISGACERLTIYHTKEREIKSLIKASKELKCSDLFIITMDYENEEFFNQGNNKKKIRFVPLWKWLLSVDDMK